MTEGSPQPTLLELVYRAHHASALNNNNISSNAVLQAGTAGKSLADAIAAALLTIGAKHAPIEQARYAIYHMDQPAIIAHLKDGYRVPGWGNSFYKDCIDPAWEPTALMLREKHLSHHQRLDARSDWIFKATGKYLHPNAAAFTAVAAEISEIPFGQDVMLLVEGRLSAWAQIWSASRGL